MYISITYYAYLANKFTNRAFFKDDKVFVHVSLRLGDKLFQLITARCNTQFLRNEHYV